MCNSGVGLTPSVDDRVHHFSAGGLYNGLVLLIDDETRTYWDHITGEALHGPLRGKRLETWGIRMTRAAAAVHDFPDLQVLESRPRLIHRLAGWAMNLGFFNGRFPPGFRRTMLEVDPRLPEMEVGLGVVDEENRRFYPLSRIGNGIDDQLGGRPLRIAIGKEDHVPFATRQDGSRPLQLFSRWYGFSATYPGCEIHHKDNAADGEAG